MVAFSVIAPVPDPATGFPAASVRVNVPPPALRFSAMPPSVPAAHGSAMLTPATLTVCPAATVMAAGAFTFTPVGDPGLSTGAGGTAA